MALTQVKSDGIADGAVTTNDLSDSGVTAGTYGSSSAIPAITVDAKGRVTSATTNSVTQVGGANGVDFNDNVKARFGTGNDLEIYHDSASNNSIIKETGAGNLKILAEDIVFRNAADNETFAVFSLNGATNFYYDSALKLNTTSTGIDVTGTVNCDGLSCDGGATISAGTGVLDLVDNNNTGNAVTNFIRGRNSANTDRWRVGQVSTGNEVLYVQNFANQNIIFNTNGADRVHVQNDGHLRPSLTDSYDLGTPNHQWRNAYFDGTVTTDGLTNSGTSTFSGDATFNGGTGAVTIATNSDIRFNATGSWSGEATKIQHHSNHLYIQGGTSGIMFRRLSGGDCARFDSLGHFLPTSNNIYDLGNNSLRWRNVYTNDLNLSNEGGTNDVDGTWGSWTIQEGEDDLFLLNRRNGKKYKFNLSEVN